MHTFIKSISFPLVAIVYGTLCLEVSIQRMTAIPSFDARVTKREGVGRPAEGY